MDALQVALPDHLMSLCKNIQGWLLGETPLIPGLSITAQYLQNLEFAVGYNWFLGNPSATVKDSPIPSNPVADRDYITLSIKYNL